MTFRLSPNLTPRTRQVASFRGKIMSACVRDIDGNAIALNPAARHARQVGETLQLVISLDYEAGNLAELVGQSLAVAPHEDVHRQLAQMTDQRAERQPSRASLLEAITPPAPEKTPDTPSQLDETAARLRELETD